PVNHCGNGVKPGSHCDVYVTFTPNSLGEQTGTLTFTDNASNSPQSVALSGEGSNTAPTATTVSASPTAAFAGQPITFTATVKSLGGGTIPDGDQVGFIWHSGFIGSAPLHNGVATFTTTAIYFFNQATQRIVASFISDGTFLTSSDGVDVHISRYNDA